ncbi:hypothetical protein IMSAGC022_00126 [Alistipes sp.]|nr:hypothetical protein IMSAGC022_00126 [Alistipes sp.]
MKILCWNWQSLLNNLDYYSPFWFRIKEHIMKLLLGKEDGGLLS